MLSSGPMSPSPDSEIDKAHREAPCTTEALGMMAPGVRFSPPSSRRNQLSATTGAISPLTWPRKTTDAKSKPPTNALKDLGILYIYTPASPLSLINTVPDFPAKA